MGVQTNVVTARTWITFQLAFVAALALRPVLAGWPLADALGFAAFLVAFVWLPGRALLAWTRTETSALEQGFLAWIVGYACLTAVFVPLCMFDARTFVWGLPPVAAIAWFAARMRAGASKPSSPLSSSPPSVPGLHSPSLPSASELIALAIVCLLVLVRIQPESPERWFTGFGLDDSFHAENAAELRWRWPLEDPRQAGIELRYHFFAYVSPAAMSVVLGLPVRACMLGLGPHLWPLLFGVGVFVVARHFGARPLLAACAALALVMHTDLGEEVLRWWHVKLGLPSPFEWGLYKSYPTALGLCCLLAVILLSARCLAAARFLTSDALLLAVVLLLASGAKGSILPPLVGGALGLAAWNWLRTRAFPAREASLALLFVLAALPMTIWLASGEQSYAQSMFRWAPGWVQRTGAFQSRVVEWLGIEPLHEGAWLTAVLLPVWVIGFLGVSGAGFLLWTRARAASRAAIELLLAFTVLAGMLPSWLLASPGVSQLFFGYVSQTSCAILGGLGAERLLASSTRAARIALGVCAAFLGVHVVAALAAIPDVVHQNALSQVHGGAWDDYHASLDWIRTNLPADAVLLLDEVRLCAAPSMERRLYHEHSRFSPLTHANFKPYLAPGEDLPPKPYRERYDAQQSFFHNPTPALLARMRADVGDAVPWFAVRTGAEIAKGEGRMQIELKPLADPESWGRELGAELVHKSSTIAVYRLPPARN